MKNLVILIGNVGNKPENISKTSNKAVTFSLATNERFKDKNGDKQQITDWHNIKVFNGLSGFALDYLDKGSTVEVQGRLKTDKYEDREGNTRYATYVLADEILLLDKKIGPAE